jgi:xanthine dehydrogenase YagS FAD-binding subunit
VRPFTYAAPADPAAAVAALRDAPPGSRFLGGGTNLVDLMKLDVERPPALVDVTRLPLRDVEEREDGGLRVGAAVRNTDLAVHPALRARFPLVSEALLQGASGQLRNAATIAGNLLQRTRCPYFQDVSKPCNKRVPGSGCPARTGVHRELAVLGHSEACVATHPSDLAVALAAVGARVVALGPGGERRVAMPGLHRLPGEDPARDTVLEPGELITHVELPPLPAGTRSTYRKVRDRASFAFALVSVAAALERDPDGTVRDVRLALGGVAHAPWRAERAEAALRGGPATPAAFTAALTIELAQARPLPDNAFKVRLANDLAVATLAELAEVA